MGGGGGGGGGGGMGGTPQGGKPGDWSCPGCGDHQFARNPECRKCGTAKPGGGGMAMMGMGGGGGGGGGGRTAAQKPGDWNCPSCGDHQFARNTECRKCGSPNPDPAGSMAAKEAGHAAGQVMLGENMKPGDWYCPGCNDLQFAKNAQCRKCATPNPDPEASQAAAMASGNYRAGDSRGKGGGKSNNQEPKPGDWHCTGCGDLQFARNTECRKCGTPNMSGGKGGGGMGGGNQAGNPAMMMQMMQMMGTMMGQMGQNQNGGNQMGGNNMMGGMQPQQQQQQQQ